MAVITVFRLRSQGTQLHLNSEQIRQTYNNIIILFSRPYLRNGRAYGTSCRPSVCLSVCLLRMYCS